MASITVRFDGIPIVAMPDRLDAVDLVLDRVRSGQPTSFRLVNAGTLDAVAGDTSYRQLLCRDGVNFPDGKPLALVLRAMTRRTTILAQIRGPWLFEACLDIGRARQVRHFLLGSTDETLALLKESIARKYRGALIVGTYSPPFGERTAEQLAYADQLVLASQPDLVWVAMGTPRQDREATRITSATGVTTVAVGAAFDFTAGTKRVAPAAIQRLGLEWLFRLCTEPRRLWKRYLFGNARFLRSACKQFLGSGWRQ